jgi:hypothetical protein
LEWEAHLAQALRDCRIHGCYTYPKSYKMNAPIDPLSRSLQESYVGYHEDLLFTDLALLREKFAQWLGFCNA